MTVVFFIYKKFQIYYLFFKINIYIFASIKNYFIMSKILDTEFRKDLYKSLVEAGYEKGEAQHIVGVKYFSALKYKVTATIESLKELVINDNYALLEEVMPSIGELSTELAELEKMDKIVNVKKAND